MNTKLTLTIEKEVIEGAKRYAREQNRSLSDLVESYLKVLTQEDENKKVGTLNPIVKSLQGSFKMKEEMDYNEELRKRLEQKYS